ncbi:type II toxin-antitoxin system VapC family toxin [Thermodesulfobacteriota bacterium]
MFLVDSDVLIWYMRGNPKAKKIIDELWTFRISSINYMELVQGIRDKSELKALRKFIAEREIETVHLSVDISQRALYYMEQYALSHRLTMADALIAATASYTTDILLTGNHKHYRPIKEIKVQRFHS